MRLVDVGNLILHNTISLIGQLIDSGTIPFVDTVYRLFTGYRK
jgi:hypothetical protein